MVARRVLLVVVAAVMLGWSSGARAQDPRSFRVGISYNIGADGTGSLIANPSPYGAISWAACPPGGVCSPVAPDPQSDRVLDVGDAAIGTVFVATAVNGSQTASASSVPYLGRVRSIAPPAINGQLRVGALVRPVAGSWGGGWGSESSFLQTQVCRSASGSGCVVIADEFYWNRCPGAGAALVPAHRGRYVRVIDERIGRDTAFPAFAVPSPARLHPIQPGPDAAAAVAGPIAPAAGPPESNCGQPPSVVLESHPARKDGRLALGRIICPQACHVQVTVRQGNRRVRLLRRLSASAALRRLWLPARLARRLKRGVATVSVSIRARRLEAFSSRRVVLPQL